MSRLDQHIRALELRETDLRIQLLDMEERGFSSTLEVKKYYWLLAEMEHLVAALEMFKTARAA